jgi:hypothetical protein
MPKLEIQFHNSMVLDKRNTEQAYLIEGKVDVGSKGFYPSIDFEQVAPNNLNSTYDILDILGSDDTQIKVIYDVSGTLHFRELGSNSVKNTSAAYDPQAFANGIDGVYFVNNAATDVTYRINTTNSNISLTGTFPSSANIDIGVFDGLYYWWIGTKMWRQLPGQNPELIMASTGFRSVKFVVPYLDYLAIFTQGEVGEYENIIVYFFNKKDSTFFSKRIEIPLARVLGAGLIDGQLTMFWNIGVRGNAQEIFSKLVVSKFDGENFTELNSIKGGRNMVDVPSSAMVGTTARYCNDYMLVAVDDNDSAKNTDLYHNFIYKISKDGSIQALTKTKTGEARNYATIVNVFRNFDLYATDETGTTPAKIYTNEQNSDSFENYDKYEEDKTYITNFYCNPYNYHKLNGFNVAFEKMFRNQDGTGSGEQLDVYYRVSDRDDWTLLGQVSDELVVENVNKMIDMSTDIPLPEQRYQIVNITEGFTALPNFNEIQFKFVSKKGFSIIGSWFEYDYITNNTLK